MHLEKEIADSNGNGGRGDTRIHLYIKDTRVLEAFSLWPQVHCLSEGGESKLKTAIQASPSPCPDSPTGLSHGV